MQEQRLALALCPIHEAQKGGHLSQEAGHQPWIGQERINPDLQEGAAQGGQQPADGWGDSHACTCAGSLSFFLRMPTKCLEAFMHPCEVAHALSLSSSLAHAGRPLHFPLRV